MKFIPFGLWRSAFVSLALAAGLGGADGAAPALSLTVKPDRETGIYAPGEKVTWEVDVKGDRTGLALPYKVKKDAQVEIAKGTIDLSTGPAKITASRDEAGALLMEIFTVESPNGLAIAMGGAIFAPEKIGPSVPEPADFDAFWQGKLKELAGVPMNPVLEPMNIDGVKNGEGMECFKVTLDNIRGTHAKGVLARPGKVGRFPALLVLNSAGVSALDKATMVAHAKTGWLVLNISAHDLPVDESDAFYKELREGSLKNYFFLGSEDREQSYFLRMLLGCVRGAEYLASREDWDGNTLVVTGISQGGLQSFATAALFPKVTDMLVDVPAGCDTRGPLATPPRAFGWPYWMSKFGAPAGRDLKKSEETSAYFDGMYFASRVRARSLVGVGLLDIASRPAGVIAAYNAIKGPKDLIIMPLADHHGQGGTQSAYFYRFANWKDALQKGKPVPLPEKTGSP